jgi:hypothetical protein
VLTLVNDFEDNDSGPGISLDVRGDLRLLAYDTTIAIYRVDDGVLLRRIPLPPDSANVHQARFLGATDIGVILTDGKFLLFVRNTLSYETVSSELRFASAKKNDLDRMKKAGEAAVTYFLIGPCDKQEGIKYKTQRNPIEELMRSRDVITSTLLNRGPIISKQVDTAQRALQRLVVASDAKTGYAVAHPDTTALKAVFRATSSALRPMFASKRPGPSSSTLVCPIEKKKGENAQRYNVALATLNELLIDTWFTMKILQDRGSDAQHIQDAITRNIAVMVDAAMAAGAKSGVPADKLHNMLEQFFCNDV